MGINIDSLLGEIEELVDYRNPTELKKVCACASFDGAMVTAWFEQKRSCVLLALFVVYFWICF